jgi:tape measure domain-containing protein
MAGLKPVGFKAVFDINEYVKNAKMFGNVMGGINKSVSAMGSVVSTAAAPVLGLGSVLGTVLAVGAGIVGAGIFQSIGREISQAGSEAMNAAMEFQRLEIRFTALAARDYSREFGVPVAEAYTKVGNAAKDTLDWIRKVAVSTPFTVETLANSLAFGQAFGFTTGQAKRLTLAMGDFTAGMGLGDLQMHNIVWNFGQMLGNGRVLGRELRDLGNSMVPIVDIVKKMAVNYGVTTEEMKKMLTEGTVDAKAFIDTFTTMAETDFAGAMTAMSRTMEGVKNNTKDFIQTMIGMETIGPIMKRISGLLADLLDRLLKDDVKQYFSALGLSLEKAFDVMYQVIKTQLIPAISALLQALGITAPTLGDVIRTVATFVAYMRIGVMNLSQFIRNIVSVIETIKSKIQFPLESIADKSQFWGSNIILQFAKGMTTALKYVFAALSTVAQYIAKWLRPGSPPLILPDLTIWGAGAMTAYMDGWLEGDFSVFDDISGIIGKYVKSFGADLPKSNMLGLLIGNTETVMATLSEFKDAASLSAEAIDEITISAGISNDTMDAYIDSIFKLKVANEQASNVTKLLGFEMGQSVTVFGQVVDSLEDARSVALSFTGAIGSAVSSYVQSLFDISAAQAEATAAQTNLNDVTKYYDDLLASLNEQQNQLNDDIENSTRLKVLDKTLGSQILTADERTRLELEKRGIILKRTIRDTELEKKTAVDVAEVRSKSAEDALKIAETTAKAQKDLAKSLADAQVASIKSEADAYKNLIEQMINLNDLMREQAEARKEAAGGGAGAETLDDPFAGFNFEGIQESVDDARKAFEDLKKTVDDTFVEILTKSTVFKITWDQEWASLTSPVNQFLFDLYGIGLTIGEFFAGLIIETAVDIDEFKTLFSDEIDFSAWMAIKGWEDLKTSLKENWDTITEVVDEKVQEVKDALKPLSEAFDKLVLAIQPVTAPLLELATSLGILTVGFTALSLSEGLAAFMDFVTLMASGGIGAIAGWVTMWADDLTTLITDITKFVEDVKKLLAGDGDFGTVLKDAWKIIGDSVLLILDASIRGGWELFKGWLDGAGIDLDIWIERVKLKFSTWWLDSKAAIAQWVIDSKAEIVAWATDSWQSFVDWKDDVINTVGEWVTGMVEKVGTMVTDVGKKWDEFKDDVKKKFDDMITSWTEFGSNLVRGIIAGIVSMAVWLYNLVAQVINNAIWVANNISGSASPSKKFFNLGTNWMAGLANGITANADLVTGAVGNVVSGIAIPSMQSQMSSISGPGNYGLASGGITNYNKNISVEVNPTYKNVQSEASVYHDVTAAIAAVRV